ncbi:hypothetical protein N1851_032752 [Merluccius polli]|uniref:Uncharacterized protein n=1 Tax=Merluccius polli TaxID=89951 RepID=A0AA47M2D8_MERPO|nr:hypothetical protein N1851_032752 [Merluccius polli]
MESFTCIMYGQARMTSVDAVRAKMLRKMGLLPVGRALNTSPGRRPGGILTRCLSHLIWLLSTQRSSGSTPSYSRMTELLTLEKLGLSLSPATLRRKLISSACTRDLILSELRAELIHPRGPATKELPDHLGDLSPRDRRAHTRVPRPCCLTGRRVGGIEESSKYSFHQSTTSRVEVSSAPSPPYTVLTIHCYPLLRRRMVVQNLFKAVRKSFFIASPNSSHVRVFASVTATAALRLACRYLPAASGVPQAKKVL